MVDLKTVKTGKSSLPPTCESLILDIPPPPRMQSSPPGFWNIFRIGDPNLNLHFPPLHPGWGVDPTLSQHSPFCISFVSYRPWYLFFGWFGGIGFTVVQSFREGLGNRSTLQTACECRVAGSGHDSTCTNGGEHREVEGNYLEDHPS